jgi:hypothetical protein
MQPLVHSETGPLRECADILACEETQRRQSLSAIHNSRALSRYAAVVDASIAVLGDISAVYKSVDDNEVMLQYLTAQILNSASAGLSLLLSGYYQQSTLLQRHMLEVGFLLDYLRSNLARAAEWRSLGSEGRLPPGFTTGRLIPALDKRDRLTASGRKQTYDILSNLAAHPTPQSRRMIVSGDYRMIGPFFNCQYLKNSLGELARNLPYFAFVAVAQFQVATPALDQPCEQFRARMHSWLGQCYGGFRILRCNADLLTEYSTRLWGRVRRRRA